MARKKILSSLQPRQFRLPRGRKEVWLPNWHITLVRTPHLPSNMAEFLVPLNINKLDLKDYLFHAYGIPALAIRSSIQQQQVRRRNGMNGPWYRPQSTKRMIVEMDANYRGGPFVWPAEETNFEAWDKQLFEDGEKARTATSADRQQYGRGPLPKSLESVQEQVKQFTDKKQVWKPSWAERKDLSGQQLGAGTPADVREQLGQ